MFIAIMLVDELERGNEPAAKGLEAWFQWHDRHADPLTGYWGSTLDCRYFHGMIGFVHQALIYNYVGRRVQHVERVIDRTLQLQQPDGLFSPSLNGASCNDLDAIHPLCYFYHTNRYRRPEIRRALEKVLPRLLANQNRDGGFCWAQRRRLSISDWVLLTTHNLRRGDPILTYFALRTAISDQLHLKSKLRTGWSRQGRNWSQILYGTHGSEPCASQRLRRC